MLRYRSSWKTWMWDCLNKNKHKTISWMKPTHFLFRNRSLKPFNYRTSCPSKPCLLLFLFGTNLSQGHLHPVHMRRKFDSWNRTNDTASTGLVPCFRKDTWPLETAVILQVPPVHRAVHGAQLYLGLGLCLQLLHGGNLKRSQVMNISNLLSQTKPSILTDLFPGFLAFLHKQLLAGL